MDKLIEIDGCIRIPASLNIDNAIDEFIAWIESKGWYFGGGFDPIPDAKEQVRICGCIEISADDDAEDVYSEFTAWTELKKWDFAGGYRQIYGDHYINSDGSDGGHI